jgi:hypothetical protein
MSEEENFGKKHTVSSVSAPALVSRILLTKPN